MNEIQITQANRLKQLHGEIIGAVRMLLDKAIEAGSILHDVKAALPHGEFTVWVEVNAGFNIRTAQRYMKIHENREKLKNDSVSLLTDAHRMLRAPREEREIRINGLSFDEVLRIAEWDEKYKKIQKRIIELKSEWETIKESKSLATAAEFYHKACDLHSEAVSLTLDAEVNLGRVLNKLEKLFPTEKDAKKVLSLCELMDTYIKDGVTAADILQRGGKDYHVEFFEDYKAMGMSHKQVVEMLRLVQ